MYTRQGNMTLFIQYVLLIFCIQKYDDFQGCSLHLSHCGKYVCLSEGHIQSQTLKGRKIKASTLFEILTTPEHSRSHIPQDLFIFFMMDKTGERPRRSGHRTQVQAQDISRRTPPGPPSSCLSI